MDLQHLALDIRIVLAGVFFLAGVLKISRQNAAASIALLEAIGVPSLGLVRLSARLLPVAESALAVILITGSRPVEALLLSEILLLTFSAVILIAMKRGYDGACSCFGSRSTSLGMANLILNLPLAIGALFALYVELQNAGPILWIGNVRLPDVLLIVVLSFSLAAVSKMIREVEHLGRVLAEWSAALK